MASRVQQDLTGEDINYFVERGFDRADDDLNTLVKLIKHGWVSERFRITGRPWGWQWYRTIYGSTGAVVRSHVGSHPLLTPTACYVNAEVAGWRNENGDATE